MTRFIQRLYESGDEEKIVQLLTTVFNGWPHFDLQCEKIDHWKWKNLDVPSGIQQAALVFDGDQLIGCNHAIYFDIKMGDNVYLGRQAVDFGVHPDFRRIGVSKLIAEVMKKRKEELGPALTYMNTSSEIIINNYKKRGTPAFPYTVRQLIRVHDVDEHLRFSDVDNKQIMKIALKGAKLASSLLVQRRTESGGHDVVEIDEFKPNVGGFWDEVKKEYRWMVARTRDYLNWRYCDPRGGAYRVTSVEEEGRLIGYCVSRINLYDPEYPTGVIVDVLSLPNRLDASKALLEDAVYYFDSKGVNCVRAWVVHNHPIMKTYSDLGFLDTRQNVNFFYTVDRDADSYRGDLEKFQGADETKIHLTYGDTDWI